MTEETYQKIQEQMTEVFHFYDFKKFETKTQYIANYIDSQNDSHIDPIILHLLTLYLNRPIVILYPTSDSINGVIKGFEICDKKLEGLELEPYIVYIEKTFKKAVY